MDCERCGRNAGVGYPVSVMVNGIRLQGRLTRMLCAACFSEWANYQEVFFKEPRFANLVKAALSDLDRAVPHPVQAPPSVSQPLPPKSPSLFEQLKQGDAEIAALLSVSQVSKALGVSRSWVYRAARTTFATALRQPNFSNILRFDPKEIQKVVDSWGYQRPTIHSSRSREAHVPAQRNPPIDRPPLKVTYPRTKPKAPP